jgi:hypothetical protein
LGWFLSNGARVTSISFYVVDNSETENMKLEFYRTEPAANISQYQIGYVTTANLPTSPDVQTVTLPGIPIIEKIDYVHYAYQLRYEPVIAGTSHLLVGARVEYSLPTGFLPLINK